MEEAVRRWASDMTDVYERLLVPAIFQPFASDLAERVAASHPRRVLELAAGTGVVTRALLGLPGVESVVATDLNSAMVDTGRQGAPGAEWQVADALDLPFPPGSFDAVICQFGIMFFPDKVAGLAEARRALAPDGTCWFSTWGPLASHALESAFTAAARAVLPDDPPNFLETVPHGYADASRLAADADAAGFSQIAVETVTLHSAPIAPRDAAVAYCTGTPTRAALEARGDLVTLTEAIADELTKTFGDTAISGEMTAHVLRARR